MSGRPWKSIMIASLGTLFLFIYFFCSIRGENVINNSNAVVPSTECIIMYAANPNDSFLKLNILCILHSNAVRPVFQVRFKSYSLYVWDYCVTAYHSAQMLMQTVKKRRFNLNLLSICLCNLLNVKYLVGN